jgi:hypothetical protein
MMTLLTTARRRISSLLLVGLLIGVFSLAPWSAQSAAAANQYWSNYSLPGVNGTATYWRGTDGRSYITGRVCDTASDGKSAHMKVQFGKAWGSDGRIEIVSAYGVGSCTSFSFNSHYTYADLSLAAKTGWGYSYTTNPQRIYFR